MSLINSSRDIVRLGINADTKYKAVVTNNVDPLKLGRVQFKIPNFFEFSEKFAPWAINQKNESPGVTEAKDVYGSFNVPRIGSFVDIKFAHGSVYHPVYHPSTIFKTVQLEESLANYPDRHILKLSNGCYLIIDEHDNFMDIFNPGDVRLRVEGTCNIESSGVCNLHAGGAVNVKSTDGNINVTSDKESIVLNCTKDCIVQAEENVTVTAAKRIFLQGKSGADDLSGIVTGNSICAFTHMKHSETDCSEECFATSGGS
jgi:hypothetical protein